ncbi:hypothetical protein ACO34A_17330 [Rhizobium sp. ACO-34A]|nr:hypothetical protein ACO34A_17330 [Rhizobium sp. ACO-34A]
MTVRLELSGSQRVDMPNGVEWAAIDAKRGMAVEFAMVEVGNDGFPIVAAKPAGAVLSPEMEGLKGGINACVGDQACLARVMMEFAAKGNGGNVFQQMTGQQPGRFHNLAGDRNGTCVTGSLKVSDTLSGVYIPPPQPARSYRFSRSGNRSLPVTDERLTDTLCGVEMTIDKAANTMSLRLPVSLPVGVTLGVEAFTDEKAVSLVEGERFLTVYDQPSDSPGEWAGSAEISGVGSASHNAGQVSAPLHGRIEWNFVIE